MPAIVFRKEKGVGKGLADCEQDAAYAEFAVLLRDNEVADEQLENGVCRGLRFQS